jgi:hypothetical protein
MATGFDEIAKKIAELIPGRFYVAFLNSGGNILYSSLPADSGETLKKMAHIFSAYSVGDFQVKKLTRSNLLVYKVSPDVVLALESDEREGVLISAAKRLGEKYADLVRGPEDKLPALLVKEVSEATSKELSTVRIKEVSSTEETEKMAKPIPQDDKELAEIRERLEKIDNLIKKRKRKLTSE